MNQIRVCLLIGLAVVFLTSCATMLETMGGRKSLSKSLSLPEGASETMGFSVNKKGIISASVDPKLKGQGTQQLTLSIIDPVGQPVLQNKGALPLKISHQVSQEGAEEAGLWNVIVTNENEEVVEAELRIYYPYSRRVASAPRSDTGYEQETPAETESVGEYEQETTAEAGPQEEQYEPEQTAPRRAQNIPLPIPSRRPRLPAYQPKVKIVSLGPKTFTITPSRKDSVYYFNVTAPGRIRINARWQGADQLALILNGPGQVNYYARKDGRSPLFIDYYVSPNLLRQGTQWKASLKWFPASRFVSARIRINGNIGISYPQMFR